MKRINVRIDVDGADELYAYLADLAARNNRSLNAEVVTALQRHVTHDIRTRAALQVDREMGKLDEVGEEIMRGVV